VEVLPRDELHRDVEGLLGLTEVEDADRVRVVQSAGGLRLALEPRHGPLIGEQRRVQHLEHHRLVERELAGPVDLAHPAFADLLLHAVLARDRLAHIAIGIRGADDVAPARGAVLGEFAGVSAAVGAEQERSSTLGWESQQSGPRTLSWPSGPGQEWRR